MPLDPAQTARLLDSDSGHLGDVAIERIEANRLYGRLSRVRDFAAVETLFLDLEEAVNGQVFSIVDRLCGEIDRLGLRLTSPDGTDRLEVTDVQIMNGNELCCRVPDLVLMQGSHIVHPRRTPCVNSMPTPRQSTNES